LAGRGRQVAAVDFAAAADAVQGVLLDPRPEGSGHLAKEVERPGSLRRFGIEGESCLCKETTNEVGPVLDPLEAGFTTAAS
jgi:hypothetical protein